MIQHFVDYVLAVTKESVKIFMYESLNITVRLINGVSALVLTILPGKTAALKGIHGWELRPTFRGPRFPRWMDNGVSSFNQFIHELSVDSDTSSLGYSSEENDTDKMYPALPYSQSDRASFTKRNRRSSGLIPYPVKFLLGLPFLACQVFYCAVLRAGSFPRKEQLNLQIVKDHALHLTTDRRRGVIEDLHLAVEMLIEVVFDVFHKVAHVFLSPSEYFRILWSEWRGLFCHRIGDGDVDVSITCTSLGKDDPSLRERKTTIRHLMNTDARTCRDVITELGYPYEAMKVVTSDGYVLLLERIPRRDSRKALYLQHGVLDTSLGWVSNGVVGSPAFAAFDHGYDVFLGNFRGLASKEHIDKNMSSRRYWRYSLNEHGMEDIPVMVEKIHQVKTCELKISEGDLNEECENNEPYTLCTISHSLGGAAMLMYLITRRMEEKPHRLSRLILLSPAGFHEETGIAFTLIGYMFLLLAPLLNPIVPGFYIPTRFLRMLFNKLARDLYNYPAIGGLVQTIMGYFVGGDSSNWVGVLSLPHYNMNDMPGVSFRLVEHLAQLKYSKKFRMYDYGSGAANMEVYGSSEALDLGEYYCLIDVPVDVVAGEKDKIIRPTMVRKHYKLMEKEGVDVSYAEFEYAHLDFTFSHREELLGYVMSCLRATNNN